MYGGTCILITVKTNCTLMLRDDPLNNGEPQPLAVPVALCGEEGLEDLAKVLFGDAAAGVGDI